MNDKTDNKAQKQAKKSAQDTLANEQSAVSEDLAKVLCLLKPLTDFLKSVEDATEDDFRMYWDVRLVCGKDRPFAHVHGTSTLSSLMAPKLRLYAQTTIEAEVRNKISMPLMASVMTELDKLNAPALERMRKAKALATGEEFQTESPGQLSGEENF